MDGNTCLTANHSAGTVSLVDLAKLKVVSEIAVGRGPADIGWLDSTTALVSLLHDDSVALVNWNGSNLKLLRTIVVGDEPHGFAIAKNRLRAFVAIGGDDAVAVLDLEKLRSLDAPEKSIVVNRIPDGGIPRTIATKERRIVDLTPEQVRQTFRKHIDPKKILTVVAGDWAAARKAAASGAK